jgi:alpha-ketoglutarate-dependent 2,4-dichlorophenoxyacetate dioxygenase
MRGAKSFDEGEERIMSITVCPVTPDFAAEIGDFDLSLTPDPADLAAVKAAFSKYSVLIFPDQNLTADQHLEFASHFGPLETTAGAYGGYRNDKTRIRAELGDASNLDSSGGIWAPDSRLRKLMLSNRIWHTDSSFKYVPAFASLLYARAVAPIGGQTEFADQRAGYDALPDDMKTRLHRLIAEHSLMYSRERLGFSDFNEEERRVLAPQPQMLVRTIPENQRKSLYVSSHAGAIRGMSQADALALIDQLLSHTTQRQFVYCHRWRLHDVVMWDNRCTLHRGRDFDDLRWRRDVQRATVSDTKNTCEQEGVSVAA